MISLTADIHPNAREWRNHLNVRRWCRQFTLISESEHAEWLKKIHSDPKIKMFGIGHSGEQVGVCGFTSIDLINRNAEFSLYINAENQDLGYGAPALMQLIDHGFDDFGLKRIWGEVFDGNPALKKFLDLGFRPEGVLRSSYFRDGKYINSHIIGMLSDECSWW